jgi:hypothetical protein
MSQPNVLSAAPLSTAPLAEEWFQPSWNGPTVEFRPIDAGPEWPEGAHHRVTFQARDFPGMNFWGKERFTQYFAADGWPHWFPQGVKPDLDARCRAEIHRLPVCEPPFNGNPNESWLRFFLGSLGRLRRLCKQAALASGLLSPLRPLAFAASPMSWGIFSMSPK